MKLFGEYLVEKNLITNEILARALIEQFKNLPTTAEVVFEKTLLSVDQLLEVFRYQVDKKCGFIESAVHLNVWNSNIATKVEDHLASIRIPLGHVLIKLGSMSLEEIIHALDNFLSECELPKTAPPPTASLMNPTESASDESAISPKRK